MNCMSCWNDKRNNWLTSVISLPRHKAYSGTQCLLDIEDIWIRSVWLQISSCFAVLVLFLGITLCEVCGSHDIPFWIRLLIVRETGFSFRRKCLLNIHGISSTLETKVVISSYQHIKLHGVKSRKIAVLSYVLYYINCHVMKCHKEFEILFETKS
jgi:hypothetical protein